MNKLLPIAALFTFGLACDVPAGTPADPEDTGDTDAPQARGVQVGSEGLLPPACSLRDLGRDDAVPGYTDTPGELADLLLRNLSVMLDGAQGPIAGTLSLQPTSYAVSEGDDCATQVVLRVLAPLDLSPSLLGPLTGGLAVRPDRTARLLVGGETFEGTLSPGFEITGLDFVVVRLSGELDATTLAGDLEFEGCDGTDCQLDRLGAISGG